MAFLWPVRTKKGYIVELSFEQKMHFGEKGMSTLQYWLFCRPPNNISAMGWFRLSIVLARVLPIPHGAPALLCLGKHLSEPGIRCEPRLNDVLQSSDNVGHDWLYKSFLRTISYNLPWKCTWISLCRIGDFERIYDRQNIEQRKPWFFLACFSYW